MNFTETYDRNTQAQYLEVVLENNTENPIVIPTGIHGYIGFPQESYELLSPPQPYTVYVLNQFTQAILSKMYPDTFEVHDNFSPITDYPSNPITTHDVTHFKMISPPEISSKNKKVDPIYHSSLHKFNLTYCQLSLQELFNRIQLLSKCLDVSLQHKYDYGIVDIHFHTTL